MSNKKSRYTKLLKAQKLIREHNRIKVENLRHSLTKLEENDLYLLLLLQKEKKENFVDTTLVMQCLEQNRKQQTLLQIRKDSEIKELLQSTRRCEILQKKQKEEENNQESRRIIELLESYIDRL